MNMSILATKIFSILSRILFNHHHDDNNMESANFLSAARDPSLREDLLLSIVYDPGRLATRIDDETIHEILCSVTREQHKHREFVFLILSLAQKRSTIIDIISRLLSPKRQQRKEQDIYEEVITYYLDTQHTTSDGDFTILGEKLVAHGQLPLVVKYIIPQFVQAVNSYRVPEKKLHDTCKRIETIYFALYEWEKKESLVEPILCLCKADPRMRQFLCTNIVNRIDKEKPKM